MKLRRAIVFTIALAIPLLCALAVIAAFLLVQQGGLTPFRVPQGGSSALQATPQQRERGRYLATLGNCAGCHTAPGGEAYAGGRAFRTDYGTVYSSNITPDGAHGIGAWSRAEFRHAMRHGVSRNGVLSPVFPYASFRRLDDADLDALQLFLRGVPASATARRAPEFRFPASLPGALTLWRLFYYRPHDAAPLADPTLAHGRYLVEGIGHCATCHGARGRFASQESGDGLYGATHAGWFAPPLHEESLQRFGDGELAHYLRGGAPRAMGAYGRMADVIAGNLQHLAPEDARAMEAWLRTLAAPPRRRASAAPLRTGDQLLARGEQLYARHCADCHGERGEGKLEKYPALVHSTAIAATDPINLIKLVMFGAVAPSTPLNPRPHTMPGFADRLAAADVAALANYLRRQAGNEASAVNEEQVRAVGGL